MTRAESELQRTERITDPALSNVDGEELVTELLARVEALLAVDTVSLLVVDTSGRYLVAHATRGLDEEIRQGFRIPVGAGFSGLVAHTGQPRTLIDADPAVIQNPLLIRRGIRSHLGVPLIAAGRVLGVLTAGSIDRRQFSDVEITLLQLAGDRIAAELASTEHRTETWATGILQRSLMPSRLPRLDGVEFAERFVPGGISLVGGDWYDAFELPSGRLGIVIGDVTGSGLRAAVVMGRLRSVLRAYAFIGDNPATVLDQVDAKFTHFEPGEMATIGFAVAEPGLDRIVVATAGHPPPLIAEPGGEPHFVDVPPGPPIGARLAGSRRTIEVELRPGATFMMYTDGLFERRHRSFTESLERLRSSLHTGPIEDSVSDVMNTMIGTAGLDDDTAVLAFRRLPDA